MARKSKSLRIMATIIAIVAAVAHLPPTKLWNAIPRDSTFWDEASTVHEPPRKFIRETAERFYETGSVEYKKYLRKKRKATAMPADEAKLAAMHLKLGHWVPVVNEDRTVVRLVHRYFTTVDSAVRSCPELRALRDKYGLTNKQLLYYMHDADPKLLRRRVHIKYGFSGEELAYRAQRANALWKKCVKEPDWLQRTYFIDECSMWIESEARKGVKVYADAHDKGFQHVLHYDQLHNNKKVKVRLIAAVNAVHGKVYLEFTTGTTRITRIHNHVAATPEHGPYMVSECAQLLLANNNIAKYSSVNPKPCQAFSQKLSICQQLATLVYVYMSVPWR